MSEAGHVFQQLEQKYNDLDVNNDDALLEWLCHLFNTAYEHNSEIPHRFRINLTIRLTRRLPARCQTDKTNTAYDILQACLKILSAGIGVQPPRKLYGPCIEQLERWLKSA